MPPRRKRPSTATPKKPPRPTTSSTSSSPYWIEFRATEDDAWYGINVRVEEGGGVRVDDDEIYLRVMYSGFSEVWDEKFAMGRFDDAEQLEAFRRRFRLSSVQLQDKECTKVKVGMVVCASYEFQGRDVKFYDAAVQSISDSEHKVVEGNQVCTCMFALFWQHGPNCGSITSGGIECICLIQDTGNRVDPSLDIFLQLTRIKLNLPQQVSNGITVKDEQKGPDSMLEGKRTAQPVDSGNHILEGENCNVIEIDEDIDLGSGYLPQSHADTNDNFYFIWIENLQKDISPENIVDFLCHRTSILCEALVFPSFCSQFYARGVIFVDNRSKIEKICNFLHNPSHVIMSSRGRPWVVTEKWHYGSLGGLFSKFKKHSPPKINGHFNGIMVVHEGTMEFWKGKQLHQLFLEFHDHVSGLHKTLAAKEEKIMQSTEHATG